eukprot:scaffold1583_cov299-Pinguiococcus_pyrenoidosus.AAC.19
MGSRKKVPKKHSRVGCGLGETENAAQALRLAAGRPMPRQIDKEDFTCPQIACTTAFMGPLPTAIGTGRERSRRLSAGARSAPAALQSGRVRTLKNAKLSASGPGKPRLGARRQTRP